MYQEPIAYCITRDLPAEVAFNRSRPRPLTAAIGPLWGVKTRLRPSKEAIMLTLAACRGRS